MATRDTATPRRGRQTAFREEYAAIEGRILEWMHRPADGVSEAEFTALAAEVFRFQTRHNHPYAAFCRSLGHGRLPEIESWRDLPALPADAFKLSEIPVAGFPVKNAAACFRSSGTTANSRGRHFFFSTGLYRESILRGWRELRLPELPVAILTLPPTQAPDSSLSFMMGVLAGAFPAGDGGDPFLMKDGGALSFDRLEEISSAGKSVLLLGTALAFLRLFEQYPRRPMPEGSWVMETGGYKGSRGQWRKEDLYAQFEKSFALPPDRVINEYGMTELSSQFYAAGLGNPHRGPHWTRARVLDPETGNEVADGGTGFLSIVDLANLGSVIAVSTRDLAVRSGDRFELIGRDPAALPRGCSLAAGEWFPSR